MIAAEMKESERVDGSVSGCGAAALANSHRTGKPPKDQNLPPKNHNFRSRELDHPETSLVSSTVRALATPTQKFRRDTFSHRNEIYRLTNISHTPLSKISFIE